MHKSTFTYSLLLSIVSASQSSVGRRQESDGVTTIQSENIEGVSISYKKTSVCETTPNVSAQAGYVRIPSTLMPYLGGDDSTPWNLSTFVWWFPARHDPENAPISIYLAGGPGEASSYAAATESGPCFTNPDSNSTTLNPWSFNNYVNMLYIDQPNYAGFSYDEVTNGFYDTLTGNVLPDTTGEQEANATYWAGRYGTQELSRMASTSQNAAKVLYEVVQAWTANFPGAQDKKLSVWGNSAAGYSATAMFAHFGMQNEALAAGDLDESKYHHLELDTLGLTNPCIDIAVSIFAYPEIANNNTYGVELLPQEIYESMKGNVTMPGGCLDFFKQCRELGIQGDPEYTGHNQSVNDFCAAGLQECFANTESVFMATTGRSSFDISHPLADPFPPMYVTGLLNQEWVQKDLGARVNFTYATNTATVGYFGTGDIARQNISNLEYILSAGVKVALVHGDRDYVCNWIGGEAIAHAAKYGEAETFRSAGYTLVTTNSSYEGGVVKQAGNFSFTRVFQSGHFPSSYQPETTYEIFMRTMFNQDVATGKVDLTQQTDYVTEGPADAWGWTDTLPSLPENECNQWYMYGTCTEEQVMAVAAGNATINEFHIITSPGGDDVLPAQGETSNGTSYDSSGSDGNSTSSSGDSSNGTARSMSAFSSLLSALLFGVVVFYEIF